MLLKLNLLNSNIQGIFKMNFSRFLILTTVIVLLLTFGEKTPAATFSVTNTNDTGAGSLRQAIIDANNNSGLDTVAFNIGSGVQTISPLTQFPTITDAVIIDGTTQPGFSGIPIIFINGTSVSSSNPGLWITAGGSTVKGLAIGNFRNGAAVALSTSGGNTIQGNYIGTDVTGTLRRGNQFGLAIDTPNNIIGGTNLSQRNVIAGSTFENLGIGGAGSGNIIKGNYIGTNAAGTASLSDGSGEGIDIINGFNANNIIGGTEPGAGNIISGNGQYGISSNGTNTVIQGNLIGTDVTGMQAIPNFSGGVKFDAENLLLGGTAPGARNVISGNGGRGVVCDDFGTIVSKVQGNYIGVNITGGAVLGNQLSGIEVNGTVLIGGTAPGAGNVISGNGTGGGFGGIYLHFESSAGPVRIEGNYIGTDATGTLALGNSGKSGIEVSSINNIIGGSQPGAGNVISGNSVGIQIGGSTTGTVQNNTIQGNFIGVDRTREKPLPNAIAGIRISAGLNNTIGGANAGAGNLIAFNNGPGVYVSASFDTATGNRITGNSIYLNNGLGIDLGAAGIAANDNCDADGGANNLQNYPALASAVSDGGATVVTGNLNSTAGSVFNVDFYASPAPDASGSGEGKRYLGSASVTTNGGCLAPLNVTLSTPNVGTLFITATATNAAGSTSEFSAAVKATGTIGRGVFDFDGDGKSDVSIFRPSSSEWWYLKSSTFANAAVQFGTSTDKPTPGDYTGDGKTDIAFWRPGSGFWFILRSENGSFFSFPFGQSGDIPAPADYDGDGKTDAAVFRPSTGTWFILNSGGSGTSIVNFGTSEDKPVAADFDGDGKADIAIFRPSDGSWWYLRSSDNQFKVFRFGVATDKPVQGDYTGDGKADIAVFRPSTGEWFVQRSEDNSFFSFPFGQSGDIPVPADYDGDGKSDAAVFRQSDSTWYLNQTTAGVGIVTFGTMGDLPVPSAFVP
jgi:parallel beta-helix repeat protein